MAVKQAPEPVPIALNDLVQESLLFVRHEIETRGIRVTTSYARRVPKIVGDRIQLQQVIVNLLINAEQAFEASCEADREIHIATRAGFKGDALFTLRDRGPAIDPDHLGPIFEGFFTTKPQGRGKGLAL